MHVTIPSGAWTPTISVIHATLGRPEKAAAAMRQWLERAEAPDLIEYIFVVNESDTTKDELLKAIGGLGPREYGGVKVEGQVSVFVADVSHSAPAWNAGASEARGKLLIQGQDDVEAPQWWDHILLHQIHINIKTLDDPVFIGVGDGYRKGPHGDLCTTAIMTRAYRDLEGHFLYPGYRSVFSDDEVTYRALRNDRDGRAKFISARNIIFKHEHHYHVKGPKGEALVPWDKTYEHENSAEAYAIGQRLFWERNPRARTDGLRTW